MRDGIFLIQKDNTMIELSEKEYATESKLQELLINYPNLLAGGQIDPANPRKWMLISREMGIPLEEGGGNWMSVDHLFLDQEGIPTFVEVKRSTDTRIRREVVGQMLDYAANAVKHWPQETIREKFEDNYPGDRPENTLQEIFGEENLDVEDYWLRVESNLRIGKVRMLFVADIIPPELERIVEFLNEQMKPAEVLAVEIKQYANDDIRTLVPKLIGRTTEAKLKKSTQYKRKWDEESFFKKMEEENEREVVNISRDIYEWAKSRVKNIWWGEGKVDGSFVPQVEHKGSIYQLFALYTSRSGGRVETYFAVHAKAKTGPYKDINKRKELLRMLNSIEGVELPPESIKRQPSIYLYQLNSEEKLDKFFASYEWFIEEVKAS